MTTETCYIERKSDKELNQEDARSLASRVRDALISFNRDIGNKRGYMIFSFPFNELAGIGGDYIKQKCVNSGVKMVSDKRVVARAVYFTDNITAELQIKLDDIMKELGMEDLRLQGENT